MTKFGAAENKMKRLMAKFAQGTPTEYPLLGSGETFGLGRKFWVGAKFLGSCANFALG